MANYKMILQYDGTRYRGWQVLPAELTIQGKLQDVLSKMAGYQVEVTGSGRTDAGVHAKGQTANFHLREEWDEDKILFYLNQYLPEDIAVCEVKRVDERFHSRYQAVEKTYLYRIHTGKIPEVFERRYVYDYTEPLDVNRMRKAAEYLCGTHDFKSFCGNKKMKKSTVRTIARRILRKLLPCLKGSRGMMALMNSLLLISLAGSTQSQKTSLKRSVSTVWQRVATSGHWAIRFTKS